jgi:hypothetical protein
MMKKRILCFVIIMQICSSFAQNRVFIPDDYFRSFLKSNYPNVLSSNDSLLVDSAANVKGALNFTVDKSYLIKSYIGIEYFTNIDTLFCSMMSIDTSVNLSTLTNLKVIKILHYNYF